ncbi:MAG: hypothetical protein EPN75_01665 [Beijerinckiaceae bacterium]|nr:MAG: hypothetical protein EPN75_01665 [Beijerinckiaceae bacterium]
MLSSVNAFGGLSSAELLTLFGANSTSSSSDSKATNSAQSTSPGVSGSSTNDPANAIKAILAQAQMETSAGGSASITTVAAAYAAQSGDSSSFLSASVTVSSPNAVQQIEDAVSLVDHTVVSQINLNPATHNGASGYSSYVAATAADAVNITIANGAVSATAMQGASLPSGLPSLTSIQQALSELKLEDQGIGWNGVEATPETTAKDVANAWWNSVGGGSSFTLVQLPSNENGAIGEILSRLARATLIGHSCFRKALSVSPCQTRKVQPNWPPSRKGREPGCVRSSFSCSLVIARLRCG